jgi:hypothetical protein
MDKVQKPSNPECYTPSSEPIRIYLMKTPWSYLKETLVQKSCVTLDDVSTAEVINDALYGNKTLLIAITQHSCTDIVGNDEKYQAG